MHILLHVFGAQILRHKLDIKNKINYCIFVNQIPAPTTAKILLFIKSLYGDCTLPIVC